MAVDERKQTNNAGGDGQADGQKLQKRVPWSGFSPGIFCSNMITEKYVGKGNDLQCIGQKLQNVENEENRFYSKHHTAERWDLEFGSTPQKNIKTH